MRAACPKQYLPLLGRAMLLHTLERLGRYPRLRGLAVGIAADDAYWPTLATEIPNLLTTYVGGAERAHTVLNGLRALETYAAPDDWVLVHDAARPCVRHADIDGLLAAVAGPDAVEADHRAGRIERGLQVRASGVLRCNNH